MNMRALYFLCIYLFVAPVFAGPTYAVYEDGFGPGWSSSPWGATVSQSTVRYFKGTTASKVIFTSPMGVWKTVASGGMDTVGYTDITFAVYNYANADDLWFVAETTTGTLGTYLRVSDYAGGVPERTWTWVRVPIAHLGLGTAPKLAYFSIASGSANAVAYFDEVQFVASGTLLESVRGVFAPGVSISRTNATIEGPFLLGDSEYIRVTTTSAGGSIRLRERMGNLKTSDYGALAIRFKTGSVAADNEFQVQLLSTSGSNLGVTVYLNASYLPDTLTFAPNTWYLMTIPMSDFGVSSASVGGVRIRTSIATTFRIDDVRFVQKLGWVMKDVTRNVPLTEGRFGKHWQNENCSTYRKLHGGNDYDDRASSRRAIYAAARGIVRQVWKQSEWGYALVIQHERNLTTNYLHLNFPSVKEGAEVARGQYLGTTMYLSSGSHLHFGVRAANYSSTVSQVGALPEQACEYPNGITYPAFSDWFFDSEMMTWGTGP